MMPAVLLTMPRRFVLVVLGFAYGAAIFVFDLSHSFISISILLILGWQYRCLLFGLLLVIVIAGGFLFSYFRQPLPGPQDISRFADSSELELRGKVLAVKSSKQRQLLVVELSSDLSGRLALHMMAKNKIRAGDMVEFIAIPHKLSPTKIGFKRRLRQAGVFAEAWIPACCVRIVQAPQSVMDKIRSIIIIWHTKTLGKDLGGLLLSMVLGEKAVPLNSAINESFRVAGLSHLLAASGFNLSIVVGVIYALAHCLSRSLWFMNITSFAGIVVFVTLAGLSPSISRAAIICTLLLLSRCFWRSLHLPAALSAALLLNLLFDPFLIADVGLQLSYLTTAGMITGVPAIKGWLPQSPDFLRRSLLDLFVAALVAQAAALPVQLYYFGELGLYALVANLVVSPLVPIVTIGGFVSVLFCLGGWLHSSVLVIAEKIDWLLYFPLSALQATVDWIALLPGAKLSGLKPGIIPLLLYYACFFAGFMTIRRR
ncbi:MAG: ComEC/Rec2 family competence protein [Candidatus Obscuribacterales bacterium]|nr:ComEC/Rec2 family competence protein [Candidatus Obscuribacterales bacterium]